MTTRRSRHRQYASFHGVEIKVQRGDFHLHQLQASFDSLVDRGAYVFHAEVRNGGAEHLYRAHHPPPVDDRWGLMAGDCVHNLRSALDHLAHQLVIAHGGSPNFHTKFPINNRLPQRSAFCRLWKRPAPIRVAGGIHPDALTLVESLQPYQGTEEGKFLWSLAKLDNFDKHEEFVVTTNLVREASTTWDGADPPPPASNAQIKFTRQPVEHDTVVARIFYDPPLAEPDPNLKFRPYLSFGGRSPLRDQLVVGTLGALVEVTQHVTALFLPYF